MRERDDWTCDDFRREVREGRPLPRPWNESDRKIYRLGGRPPQPGDLIVFWFASTGADSPGLCGVGVITEFGEDRQLRFRALPPTKTLQENPRRTARLQQLVDAIRTVTEGTMWRIKEAEHIRGLLLELFDEWGGKWLREWARMRTAGLS